MKIAMLCLAAALGTGAVRAGPLGLEAGMSLGDLKQHVRLRPEGHYEFSTRRVPQGSEFASYRLLVTPSQGLCRITAWSELVRSDTSGARLRARFKQLELRLASKSGPGYRDDRLDSNSLWTDSHDWMLALSKNERSLGTLWEDETLFDDSVQSVELSVHAVSQTLGRLRLRYEFTNTPACTEWIRRARDRAL